MTAWVHKIVVARFTGCTDTVSHLGTFAAITRGASPATLLDLYEYLGRLHHLHLLVLAQRQARGQRPEFAVLPAMF